MGNPYMKMLSVTNLTAASADFHSIRGGQANTTVSATGVSFNSTTSAASGSAPSGSSITSDLEDNVNKLVTYVPALLGILGFNSVVLLGLAICAMMYFVRRGKGKGKTVQGDSASTRDPYHYQRVRSQYDPQDIPPSSPNAVAMPLNDVPAHSRPASSLSKKKGSDSPFAPPVEIRYDDADGELANPGLRPLDTNIANHPGPPSAGSSAINSANDLPVPRPRFVSTTTMGSNDMYGRPQSLFSVSSGPLLGAGQNQMANRPASTYETPMAAPRARLISNPMSDGRPESTLSTSPLMARSGNSPGPGSPHGDRMHRPSDVDGEEMMPPPRPRFMSDANMGPRPDSSFSMGAGAVPMRPQSKFIDASGERPFSQAM